MGGYRYFLGMLIGALLVACSSDESGAEKIGKIADEFLAFKLEASPLSASQEGVYDYNDRLDDLSPEARAAFFKGVVIFQERLRAINPNDLPAPANLNYHLLDLLFENQLLTNSSPHIYLAPLSLLNFATRLQLSVPRVNPRTERDYLDYLKRLEQIPRYFEQNISLLQSGIESGWTQNCAAINGIHRQFELSQTDSPDNSPFYTPFLNMPGTLDEEVRSQLRAQAGEIIQNKVNRAYAAAATYIEDTYYDQCREEAGLHAIDGGSEFYQRLLRYVTTTDMTPEEIHQLGLSEVERITIEMETIRERVGFDGTFQDFNEHLRSDPRFFASSPEELLHLASYKVVKIQGMLPQYFGKLPRIPVTVRPVPDNVAERMAAAFLSPPAADGSSPGIYNINLAHLDSQPLYVQTALALHEAVPGHHLHLALQTEIDAPAFRRGTIYMSSTQAFTEGWALYCEYLGEEMGVYDSDYELYGRLSYEIWRAIRLVVDTGIHAFGWSREQAIEYGMTNSAMGRQDIINEIDRFIVWPAQATAYKIGELTIQRIRKNAEERLGPQFDIRAFHDALLSEGSLPLDLLERRMAEWVQAQADSL